MTKILHTKVEAGQKMYASDILDLTFFPVGAILMMDGSWTDGRGGWYICDGRNTPHGQTPNLKDLFIRGGTSSGATGGSNDAQSITLSASNLPSHKHSITDKAHTHTQDAHNHTQDSHNHTQVAHNHTQNSHNHTQDSHNHTQSAHGHTDTGHSHSHSHSTHTGFTSQFTQVGFDNTYGVTAVGTGNTASNSGEADQKIQISYTPDAHSTDSTTGTASISSETAVNIGTTATNQEATAVNVETTATNQGTTATNQAATATNQAAGTGITETEYAGDGAPITVNAVPAYYTMIYIKKMA